jgi:mycothiol synthase
VNLVIAPDARGAGVGRALAEAVLDAYPGRPLAAWSHGNHPAAARLAAALGLARVRDLWVMRRPLSPEHPLPEVTPADGIVVRTFRRGEDEDAFLAVNAEAFAGHPEQGAMTRAGLEERLAEPWFDADGLFLAEPADAPHNEANDLVDSPSLLGFHWTKVHEEGVGEVYVVGISPAVQGRGLGKTLTLTGLHHLRDRGLREVILYVEADNAPAIAVYSGLGFTHADADTDVRYARG